MEERRQAGCKAVSATGSFDYPQSMCILTKDKAMANYVSPC